MTILLILLFIIIIVSLFFGFRENFYFIGNSTSSTIPQFSNTNNIKVQCGNSLIGNNVPIYDVYDHTNKKMRKINMTPDQIRSLLNITKNPSNNMQQQLEQIRTEYYNNSNPTPDILYYPKASSNCNGSGFTITP
jgi:hypothetical protein